MSNEILFYDVSIQSSVRANKCFAPNTLYECPQKQLTTSTDATQSASLRAQLQGVALQDRMARDPGDRAGREEARCKADQNQAQRVGSFH